ncbi:hypothetical protein ACFPN1_16220 [Lysobacter yangpyeongensis]|uniref:Uncharacterized protein n=1 Tax=Lysobacter yangpyeongensis TaxID=346182 RepID=A0ABW0SSH1_9GAMM
MTHYLFGDFSVEYRSSLSVSEAVGRLTAIADESILPAPGRDALLHGYVTRHEVFLHQGNTLFINPFRPRFMGAFVEEDGVALLRGRIVAMRLFKVWLSAGILMLSAIIFSAVFLPRHVHIDGSPGEFLLVLGILGAFLLALRIAMLPASPLVRSLEGVILSAISGERPNNSFKPKPLRGSA